MRRDSRAELRRAIEILTEALRAVRDEELGAFGRPLVCGELRCTVTRAIEQAETIIGGGSDGKQDDGRNQ